MHWDDPATSQKQELHFAIDEMRRCISQGLLTKNAPILCIVKQGELYAADDNNVDDIAISERQRRSAVNLILEACAEANRSGLFKKHTFTAEVVRSLRALRGNKECIKIVLALISSNGGRCKHRIAMEEAIYAASEERDYDALEKILAAFENSGYDSRRLSL